MQRIMSQIEQYSQKSDQSKLQMSFIYNSFLSHHHHVVFFWNFPLFFFCQSSPHMMLVKPLIQHQPIQNTSLLLKPTISQLKSTMKLVCAILLSSCILVCNNPIYAQAYDIVTQMQACLHLWMTYRMWNRHPFVLKFIYCARHAYFSSYPAHCVSNLINVCNLNNPIIIFD